MLANPPAGVNLCLLPSVWFPTEVPPSCSSVAVLNDVNSNAWLAEAATALNARTATRARPSTLSLRIIPAPLLFPFHPSKPHRLRRGADRDNPYDMDPCLVKEIRAKRPFRIGGDRAGLAFCLQPPCDRRSSALICALRRRVGQVSTGIACHGYA